MWQEMQQQQCSLLGAEMGLNSTCSSVGCGRCAVCCYTRRDRQRYRLPQPSVPTVWYDRHSCWVQACAQHGVLLAGVAYTNDVLHIRQHCLDELVRGNAGSISKAEQGVVSEHHLRVGGGDNWWFRGGMFGVPIGCIVQLGNKAKFSARCMPLRQHSGSMQHTQVSVGYIPLWCSRGLGQRVYE